MKNLEFYFERPNRKYKPNRNNWTEPTLSSGHFRSDNGHFEPTSTTLNCTGTSDDMIEQKSRIEALELELSMIRRTMDRLQVSGNILLTKLEKELSLDEIPFSSPKIQGAWAWQTPRRDSTNSNRDITILQPRRTNGNERRKLRSSQLRNLTSNVIQPQRQNLKHSSDEEEHETSRKFRIFERNLNNFRKLTDRLYRRRFS